MTIALMHGGSDQSGSAVSNPCAPDNVSVTATHDRNSDQRPSTRDATTGCHNRTPTTNHHATTTRQRRKDHTSRRLPRRVRVPVQDGQWPDGPYLQRWMVERYPDLPPNQVDNILATAFRDPACQRPVAH